MSNRSSGTVSVELKKDAIEKLGALCAEHVEATGAHCGSGDDEEISPAE
jgi:hypothetical protein